MERAAPASSGGSASVSTPPLRQRAAWRSRSKSPRRPRVTGVARVAGALRRSGSELRSLRRPQTTSPARQSSSSHWVRKPRTRAGRTAPSQAAAGSSKALQALDGAPQAGLAVEGVAGGGVLPANEEAHEVADGDGLDFAAQAVEREAVDAGQEAAVADVLDGGIAEVSREDEAADLKLHEAAGDIFGSEAAAACQVRRGWLGRRPRCVRAAAGGGLLRGRPPG